MQDCKSENLEVEILFRRRIWGLLKYLCQFNHEFDFC